MTFDPDDEPVDTPLKRRIREASERVRSGKKNIFNVAAAHAAHPKHKKPIKLATVSIQRSDSE